MVSQWAARAVSAVNVPRTASREQLPTGKFFISPHRFFHLSFHTFTRSRCAPLFWFSSVVPKFLCFLLLSVAPTTAKNIAMPEAEGSASALAEREYIPTAPNANDILNSKFQLSGLTNSLFFVKIKTHFY